MNSIGVDFKLKYLEILGKKIRMQIVLIFLINKNLNFSGILQDKKDLEQLLLVIIGEQMQ
jgi:hypothetical protein